MPLLSAAWFLCSLTSLALWGEAGFLLWSYFYGDLVRTATGALVHQHEAWRLAVGLLIGALLLFGRFIILPLITQRSWRPLHFNHRSGRTIATDHGALYLEERGERGAPLIVLCHGQALDSSMWTDLAGQLEREFRVVSWDLPGLGRSQPVKELSLQGAACALRSVLHDAGAASATIVGQGFGGMVVQELAKQDPEFFARCVDRVALLNTTHVNPARTTIMSGWFTAIQRLILEPSARVTAWLQPLARINRWQAYLSGVAHLANRIQFSRGVTRELLAHATLVATRNSPAAIELRNLSMLKWTGLDPTTLKKPVLVISGGKDIITRPEASEEMVRQLPDARLILIEEANHMGPFEQYVTYALAIATFARSKH